MESDIRSLIYLWLFFMQEIFLPLLSKFLESIIRVCLKSSPTTHPACKKKHTANIEDSCLGGGGGLGNKNTSSEKCGTRALIQEWALARDTTVLQNLAIFIIQKDVVPPVINFHRRTFQIVLCL